LGSHRSHRCQQYRYDRPQTIVIVPVAIGAGIVFTLRRSFWSLVCFGYPFTFGLISAWIGYKEMPGYERTVVFAVSIGLGLVGVVLVAVGLWLALTGIYEASMSNKVGGPGYVAVPSKILAPGVILCGFVSPVGKMCWTATSFANRWSHNRCRWQCR
jgi:hypothetical protein